MWTYSQTTGALAHNGDPAGVGYSGFEAGLNDPASEGIPDVGPIPAGNYTFGAVLPIGPGHTGVFVIPLVPDTLTRAKIIILGRGPDSFFCHGDTASDVVLHLELASRGCIIASRVIREAIALSIDKQLMVTI